MVWDGKKIKKEHENVFNDSDLEDVEDNLLGTLNVCIIYRFILMNNRRMRLGFKIRQTQKKLNGRTP